jgi:hypothetical protein
LVFPASFSSDEPLIEVLTAINKFKKIKVFVTGDYHRTPSILSFSSNYVQFTGFLNQTNYKILLSNSFGIITGTKNEYTLMMSAWEAIAFQKPLIVSETKTLRNMFNDYAIFYNWNNQESILNALLVILIKKDLTSVRKKLKEKTMKSLIAISKRLKEI